MRGFLCGQCGARCMALTLHTLVYCWALCNLGG